MKHIIDDFPLGEIYANFGAPIIKSAPAPKKNIDHNPQTANRSGEAKRRLNAEYRRNKASIMRARNWNAEQERVIARQRNSFLKLD